MSTWPRAATSSKLWRSKASAATACLTRRIADPGPTPCTSSIARADGCTANNAVRRLPPQETPGRASCEMRAAWRSPLSGRLTQHWFESTTEHDLTEDEFIELILVAIAGTTMDSFYFAVGNDLEPLPAVVLGFMNSTASIGVSTVARWSSRCSRFDAARLLLLNHQPHGAARFERQQYGHDL